MDDTKGKNVLKRIILIVAMLLLAVFSALAEGEAPAGMDGVYELPPLVALRPGETYRLIGNSSYYSGDTVYKGESGQELKSACVLHALSVMLTNGGKPATAQELAYWNNHGYNRDSSWTAIVTYGRIGSRYKVKFSVVNLLSKDEGWRKKKLSMEERQQKKLSLMEELLFSEAVETGLVIHFNSTRQLNGQGNRHTVIAVGAVYDESGNVVDLLLSDSGIPAPDGACVRLGDSSLPERMLGEKMEELSDEGIALGLMDYAVSCRYLK